MASVELIQLTRSYGSITVLHALNLKITRGEFFTLLGPSGCWKTTALRMIAGLETITSGQIKIGDRIVSDGATGVFQPPEKRQLGMVFQSYAIWPHLSVFENVAYPLRVRRTPRSEIAGRVTEALELVEMAQFASRPAPALSGGQQQRVAIARALVSKPDVLLLDEPLSNLDARLRAQLGEEFRRLQRKLGITTIYVTHDQEEAIALSDRIAVLRDGAVLQCASADELYRRPSSRSVAKFLGEPNIVSAKIISVRSLSSVQRCEVAPDCAGSGECFGVGLTVGAVADLVVRPETIELARTKSDFPQDWLSWDVLVRSINFRGRFIRVTARVGNHDLVADLPSRSVIGEGERVAFGVRPDDVWAIGGDAQ